MVVGSNPVAVTNRNSIKRYEICSKLTKAINIVNFDHILYLFLVFLLLILSMHLFAGKRSQMLTLKHIEHIYQVLLRFSFAHA